MWRECVAIELAYNPPETGFMLACWYRRTFEPPRLESGERLILHFGAVDDRATVWVNDHLVALARHALPIPPTPHWISRSFSTFPQT